MLRAESLPRPSAPGYAGKEPTKPPDWHGLVVWDVFLNAASTGLFLTAAVTELAAPGLFAPVAAWVYPAALAVLVADLLCLVLDLGDPLRFHHMLRVFKPSSPMSLGTWFLTAYSVPLGLVVGADVLASAGLLPEWATGGWVRTGLLAAGLPVAFGAMAYKGVLFSTTAQPGWRDARWLGAYHTTSATALGGAVLLALAALAGHSAAASALRPAVVGLLVLSLVPLVLLGVELWPALAGRYPGTRLRLAAVAVAGAVVVAPGALLVPAGEVAAAGCVLLSGWLARFLIVMLPQPAHERPRG